MLKKASSNPFRYYLSLNPEVKELFLKSLNTRLEYVLTEGYQLEPSYVKICLAQD